MKWSCVRLRTSLARCCFNNPSKWCRCVAAVMGLILTFYQFTFSRRVAYLTISPLSPSPRVPDPSAFSREPFPTHADVHRLHREAFGVATDSASGNNDRDGGGGCLGIPGDDGDVRRTRQREFVERVRHYLGRLRVLQRPKVSRLFYSSVVDAKCLKADPIMR